MRFSSFTTSYACCGLGGTYNVLQPAIAAQLRDRKIANVPRTGADVVATGNVGCISQLGLASSTPVVHTIELLDWRPAGRGPRILRTSARARSLKKQRKPCEATRVIDPKQLLNQVLGSGIATDMRSAGGQIRDRLNQASGTQALGGGAVAGGLLGLLLGGEKMRKMASGALGYGGAAVVGALALRAYQNYQQQKAGQAPAVVSAPVPAPAPLPHVQPATDGSPFELVLVRAMVGAAKADGHIDAKEQKRLFAEVERLGLDAETKAYVFDLLTTDVDLPSLTAAVATPEQGAELYLAARLTIDPDEPAERAYLDALVSRLQLPAELRTQLDRAPQEAAAVV